MYPLPGNGQAGTYILPQIFRPFGQNATFLPAYTLPYTYAIREKIEMKLYHSGRDSYIYIYIDAASVASKYWKITNNELKTK
jgi:hypothetical protein